MLEKNPEFLQAGPVTRQPIFNVPLVILVLLGCFVAVQLAREFSSAATNEWILLNFAFTPLRISVPVEFQNMVFPGGLPATIWTFFSHMFLHGDWAHLLINGFWMLAFGSVLARRLGATRFLIFSLVTAAFGAAGNLLAYWGQFGLMVGASGAISGQMAGAIRLMFSVPGGLANLQAGDFRQVRVLSLWQLLQSRKAVLFISVWLVLNLVFGFSGIGAGDNIGRVAWEAHLGGFISGLLLFGVFDRKS